MPTLDERYTLFTDARFRNQIRISMAEQATDLLLLAAPVSDEDKKRLRVKRRFAERLLRDPDRFVEQYALAISSKVPNAMFNPDGTVDDADVGTLVSAALDVFANVEEHWQAESLPIVV